MGKEDDLEVGGDNAAAAPKSNSKMFVIIAVVVLFLGISTTATLLLTGVLDTDDEQSAAAENPDSSKAAGKKAAKKARTPLNYVPLDPAFVVNFSGDTDVRFLQITVELGTRDVDVREQIREHRPAIRNNLVMLFGSQDPVELNTREGKEKLRAETLAEVQKVLKQETGDKGVEKVFFTSFVMQ